VKYVGNEIEPQVIPGFVGLINQRNDCYINGIIQCLSNVPVLVPSLLSFDKNINMDAVIRGTEESVGLFVFIIILLILFYHLLFSCAVLQTNGADMESE
jgi:ubiquitin C-terminal hydrolase